MTLHIKLTLRILVFLRFNPGFLFSQKENCMKMLARKEKGLKSSGDYFKALMKT